MYTNMDIQLSAIYLENDIPPSAAVHHHDGQLRDHNRLHKAYNSHQQQFGLKHLRLGQKMTRQASWMRAEGY
jgi:hypothetical protein